MAGPKVLVVDIETAPITAQVWGLWDQTIGLNQIKQDWHILAWAAKWIDSPKVHYMDQRNARKLEDDKKILKGIWKLLDAADVIVTQNGKSFDEKKLNARFILNGMKPPSSYIHIDTKRIATKKFGFTSNKLEYLSKLNKKFKKLSHKKFPGHELWTECLKGNKAAWAEMKTYNQHDVLATEEVYKLLQPWDSSINFSGFYSKDEMVCACGSRRFKKNGYKYTSRGKYQRYVCLDCGSEAKGSKRV